MKKDLSKTNEKGLYLPQFEHDSCGVGFVADIKGRKSHKIVEDALKVLVRMNHRGATGAEENTGDGAGILTQLPHKFFQMECEKLHIVLPEAKSYAVGMVFLPIKKTDRDFCEKVLEKIIAEEGQIFLGWRDVSVNNKMLGATAKDSQPVIRQIFIGKGENIIDNAHFERKLFVIRRWAKELITRENGSLAEQFYSLKHAGQNLAISLQEFIMLSFLYRKKTIKRILFAFLFQTSALPVQSRLVHPAAKVCVPQKAGQKSSIATRRSHTALRRRKFLFFLMNRKRRCIL